MSDNTTTAGLVRGFRLLLRNYVDLAREDWSDDVCSPAADEIVASLRANEEIQAVLREVLLCLFLDPNGAQEQLLLRICESKEWRELREELAECYLRRPRPRGDRRFRELAGRLGVDI
jgi:hypothetical protein